MCRIAGIISGKISDSERYQKVSAMCNALQHGGPDDEGILSFADADMAFGHRRLSIIDLSKNGHQPMADVQQHAWITFNGEIYNYAELKNELLAKGARFKSETDTEVIIQAYLHWGTAGFNKLRGMFAFALYDIGKALTYLVRDSTGIKPLYYFLKDNELAFASEVRAFKQACIANKPNKNWLINFLAFGHVPEPYTTLENVYSLPKGHYICWNHNNSTYKLSAYNLPLPVKYISNINEAKQSITDGLTAAIKRQLIADAPLGVFLSGGIDSSLITLLANEQKHQQLKTVSLFFSESAYNEHAYQEIVSDKIEGEKFTHLVKQQDFELFFPDIISAMDMPTTDGINSWFISKYAHQDGLKAVLSGIGADEYFGGYPSFNRIKYIKQLRKIAPGFLKTAGSFASDRYKKISYLTHRHPLADYLFLRGLFAPVDIAAILNCDENQVCEVLFSADAPVVSGNYDKEQAAWFESNLYMQNQLLRDTDVMSMNHGLEVRVPFLDEDFKNVVNSISPQIRFDKSIGKKLLIDSFKDILPTAIWNRKKMGFSFPLQDWMRNNDEMINESLYKTRKAKSIIKKFKNNEVHWSKAFALYQAGLHV